MHEKKDNFLNSFKNGQAFKYIYEKREIIKQKYDLETQGNCPKDSLEHYLRQLLIKLVFKRIEKVHEFQDHDFLIPRHWFIILRLKILEITVKLLENHKICESYT